MTHPGNFKGDGYVHISAVLMDEYRCQNLSRLPQWLSSKESICNSGAAGSVPGSGRSSGERRENPLQYSCLGNPTDRGAWQDYSSWGHKALDATGRLNTTTTLNRSSLSCVSYTLIKLSIIFLCCPFSPFRSWLRRRRYKEDFPDHRYCRSVSPHSVYSLPGTDHTTM